MSTCLISYDINRSDINGFGTITCEFALIELDFPFFPPTIEVVDDLRLELPLLAPDFAPQPAAPDEAAPRVHFAS